MAVKSLRYVKYDATLVPTGGVEVVGCLAAPIKCSAAKEAAGHPFHQYALRQAGLLGASFAIVSNLRI